MNHVIHVGLLGWNIVSHPCRLLTELFRSAGADRASGDVGTIAPVGISFHWPSVLSA